MEKTVISRLSKLTGYNSQYAIIRYNDKEIGKIPLSFLVFFDVFDSIIEFDNIITFPNDLVDYKIIEFFINKLENILNNTFDDEFINVVVDVIIICDFLQYDKNMFQGMLQHIDKNSHRDDILIITHKLLMKTGRLYFDDSLPKIDINSGNSNDFLCVLKYFRINEYPLIWDILYEKLYYYYYVNKTDAHKHEFVELICAKVDVYHNVTIKPSYLSDKHVEDWTNYNINSPIAKLYSINMNDAKNIKDIFSIYSKRQEKCSEMKIVNYEINGNFMKIGYLQNINALTCPNIEIYGCKKDMSYHYRENSCYVIYFDKGFLTPDWILVIT